VRAEPRLFELCRTEQKSRSNFILKMGIQEAVAKSAESLTIYIVKEALFCNVYEQSAWRFIELIKPYKPIKKRVKKLNMDVVSIGFPKSQLYAISEIARQNGFTLAQEESGSLTIKIPVEPYINFDEWKQSIPLNLMEKPCLTDQSISGNQFEWFSIVKEVELYTVADHTPMQSMQFLIDLQNKIKLVKKMPE
jgi:hypothetical protein